MSPFENPDNKGMPETEPGLHLSSFSRNFFCFPGGLKILLWKQRLQLIATKLSMNGLFEASRWDAWKTLRCLLFTACSYPGPIILQGFCPLPSCRISPYKEAVGALPLTYLQFFCSISLFVLQQHLQAPKAIKASLLWLSLRHLIRHTLFKCL